MNETEETLKEYRKILRNRYDKMKERCYKEYSKIYKHYGGRGITICDEWLDSFENFYDWSIENGFNPELSLDRIDVNGNYEPNNCRWVTWKEQARNKTNNVKVVYKGKEYLIPEISEMTGINEGTLYHRHSSGWTVEEMIETPLNDYYVLYEHNGTTKTLSDWSRECGISAETLKKRIEKDWDSFKVLNEPTNSCFVANKTMVYNGEEKTLKEWARIYGIEYKTIWKRWNEGWTPNEVIHGRKRLNKVSRIELTFDNKTLQLYEWAELLNVNKRSMVNRYKKGYNDTDVIFGRKEQDKRIREYYKEGEIK